MKKNRLSMATAAALSLAMSAVASANLIVSVYHNDGGLTTGNDAQFVNAKTWTTTHSPDQTFEIPGSFQYGGSSQTKYYLNLDGANTADTADIGNTLFDAHGFIVITTPGNYTFNLLSADDAAQVIVAGTPIAVKAWTGSYSLPTSATVTLAAGSHAFQVLHWNDWGGAGLNLSITGPGEAAFTTAIPEPATFALLGVAGLLIAAPRRSRCA